MEEAAAYLEETGERLDEYLELDRDRSRGLFGLDQPPPNEDGDQRRVATVWSLSLDRVREAPAAEALLSVCTFLAPTSPASCQQSSHSCCLRSSAARDAASRLASEPTATRVQASARFAAAASPSPTSAPQALPCRAAALTAARDSRY